MNNFSYYNPVKILFGKGQIAAIRAEIPPQAKVLLLYGGGSIKQNGVYAQVKAALDGFEVHEFGGIEANPRYETLMQAVAQVKAHQIDFLLAAGGGSVLDGTKFVAAASCFKGSDPWDILAHAAPVETALPIGAVLTLPATGSEMNAYAVISHTGLNQKRSFTSTRVMPHFSVLDPCLTFTLPLRQVGNGIVDAFTHVMEQYLTYPAAAPLQDRFAESILATLVEVGPKTYQHPHDYESRASLMWCATLALNSLISTGVPQDWTTHRIGHELTALHGLDHAQTLAIILPAVMQVKREGKRAKLLQYAERIWGLREGSEEARIDAAIARTRAFFESVGVPTHLAAYQLAYADVAAIPSRLEALHFFPLGERQDIFAAEVDAILKLL